MNHFLMRHILYNFTLKMPDLMFIFRCSAIRYAGCIPSTNKTLSDSSLGKIGRGKSGLEEIGNACFYRGLSRQEISLAILPVAEQGRDILSMVLGPQLVSALWAFTSYSCCGPRTTNPAGESVQYM